MPCKTMVPVMLVIAAVLQSCGSSEDRALRIQDIRPESSRPAITTDVDIFNEIVAPALEKPEDPGTDSSNLFASNADFENGISGWGGCLFDSIEASNVTHDGSGAVEIKPQKCLRRSVKVIGGESYTLSCHVKLATQQGWTGMGINFSSTFRSLHESPIAIATSGEYTRISTTGIAPETGGSVSVHMWLYSDQGAFADNCSLVLTSDLPAIETKEFSENLLTNGDFSRADKNGVAADWSTGCGGTGLATGAGLYVSDGACADQALTVSAVEQVTSTDTVTFSCLVTEVSGYSDLSIFLDNELRGFQAVSSKDKNRRISISVNSDEAVNGFVSLYSEGNFQVEDCLLGVAGAGSTADTSTEQVSTEQASPEQPSPEQGDVPTTIPINGNFDDLGADGLPLGWTVNNCGGDNWSAATVNGSARVNVADYTCVEYVLSAADIALLIGNEFSYSCGIDPNKEHGGGGIIIDIDGDTELSKVFTGLENHLKINGTAPDSINSARVEIYSAGENIAFFNCSLTLANSEDSTSAVGNATSEEVPQQPVNATTTVNSFSDFPADWSLSCGDSASPTTINGQPGITLNNYSCFSYTLTTDELALIQGQSYSFQCKTDGDSGLPDVEVRFNDSAFLNASSVGVGTVVAVSGMAPDNVATGSISIASVNQTSFYECSLTVAAAVSP